MLLGLVTIK